MQIDQSAGEETDEESSEDELATIAKSSRQAMPIQNNKKRTLEQRSPQKQPTKTLVQEGVLHSPKAKWTHYIAQGVVAFREALKLVEGQDPALEEATRDLFQQAQAVQQGRSESALAATRELAKEIQALKEHVLKATKATTNTANTTRQAKKTYADAAAHSVATYPNKTPLLGQSTHAALPQQQQEQERKNRETATQRQRQSDLKRRQLVVLVEEANAAAAEAVDPLAQRNAINTALQAVSNAAAVIASVRLTAKRNLILTTTEGFTADFLLQHTEAWKQAVHITCRGMQKQEDLIQVVAHKVYMHKEFLLSPAALKAEIETFNNVAIKGNPRWLAKRERLENAHLLPPDQRYASVVFEVDSEQERQSLLSQKQLSIAGRVAYLTKYHDISAKTQCQGCFKLGHNREMCRNKGCKLCAGAHYTKDHASCKECKTTGRLCEHQKPYCINCKGEHTATSRQCPYLATTTTPPTPLC